MNAGDIFDHVFPTQNNFFSGRNIIVLQWLLQRGGRVSYNHSSGLQRRPPENTIIKHNINYYGSAEFFSTNTYAPSVTNIFYIGKSIRMRCHYLFRLSKSNTNLNTMLYKNTSRTTLYWRTCIWVLHCTQLQFRRLYVHAAEKRTI